MCKFKEFRYWSRCLLIANIDKGSMNPGLLGKPKKNRSRFHPVANYCALVELKAQEPPP